MGDYGIIICALSLFLLLFTLISEAFMREPWWRWGDLREAMGQFGDSFGGVINPIFGFLTICLLVTELRATRRAAEEARKAQEKTEKALRDQLAEAKSQNNFANYYKHLEEFNKYYQAIINKYPSFNFSGDVRRLHSFLFPRVQAGDFSVNEKVTSKIAEAIKDMIAPFSQWGRSEGSFEKNKNRLIDVQSKQEKVDISHLFRPHLKLRSKTIHPEGNRASNIEKISIYLAVVCYEFNYTYRSEFEEVISYLENMPGNVDRSDPSFDSILQKHLDNASEVRRNLEKVRTVIKSVANSVSA